MNRQPWIAGLLRALLGLIIAAGVLGALATACGFLGGLWWRFDHLAHFPLIVDFHLSDGGS